MSKQDDDIRRWNKAIANADKAWAELRNARVKMDDAYDILIKSGIIPMYHNKEVRNIDNFFSDLGA
jgi:hypothetical protein